MISHEELVEWIKTVDDDEGNLLQIPLLQELAEHRKHDVNMYIENGVFFNDHDHQLIGYLIDDFDFQVIEEEDIDEIWTNLGLSGNNHNLFENGYLIPARNINNEIIFWINYSFTRNKDIKYINVFTKLFGDYDGNVKIYGLECLPKAIEQDRIVVVEGVFDAMLLNWYGVPTVAFLGTEITDYQKEFLKRFNHIIYVQDNDRSGEVAWRKFSKLFPKSERYSMLSGYKDPDDLHKNSKEKFNIWLNELKKL